MRIEKIQLSRALAAAVLLFLSARPVEAASVPERHFRFSYGVIVGGLQPGHSARVWAPVPPSDAEQQTQMVDHHVPGTMTIKRESRYGNQILYFEAVADAAGKIPFSVTYLVRRRESAEAPSDPHPALPDELFLRPDALVPSGGRSLGLLKGMRLPDDPLARARCLYNIVNDHLTYRKDKPGFGRGDSDWACDSGFGNCTDFHSLFISLARAQSLPAKFEIGFSLPETPGRGPIAGYHCWAWFKPQGHGWTPADISEASKHPEKRDYYFGHLPPDRIAFSIGRDLVLNPSQEGPPLNYFVYPYVEVDGKPWPADKLSNQFSYEDVPSAPRSSFP